MRKPSYSAVTSTLALVVARSGAGYAFSVPDKSVGTRHLKDEAVTTPKMADGAVTIPKIGDGAVSTAKLKKAAVVGSKIAPGAVGSTDIDEGSVLLDHLGFSSLPVSGVQRVYSGNQLLAANGTAQAYANCPTGKVVVGGGWYSSSYQVEVAGSRPEDIDTWVVDLWNTSSGEITLGAWAMCVDGEQDLS